MNIPKTPAERWGWLTSPTTQEVVGFLFRYLHDSGQQPAARIAGHPYERRALLPVFLGAIVEQDAQLRGEDGDEIARAREAREKAEKIAESLAEFRNPEGRLEAGLYAPARALLDRQAPPDDPLLYLGKLLCQGLGTEYRGASTVAYDAIVALQQAAIAETSEHTT